MLLPLLVISPLPRSLSLSLSTAQNNPKTQNEDQYSLYAKTLKNKYKERIKQNCVGRKLKPWLTD